MLSFQGDISREISVHEMNINNCPMEDEIKNDATMQGRYEENVRREFFVPKTKTCMSQH